MVAADCNGQPCTANLDGDMECDCGDAFEGDNCESETCKDKKTELVLHKRSVVELFKGGCERLIHDG